MYPYQARCNGRSVQERHLLGGSARQRLVEIAPPVDAAFIDSQSLDNSAERLPDVEVGHVAPELLWVVGRVAVHVLVECAADAQDAVEVRIAVDHAERDAAFSPGVQDLHCATFGHAADRQMLEASIQGSPGPRR